MSLSLARLRARLLSGEKLTTNECAALLAALDVVERANERDILGRLDDELDAFDEAIAGLTDSEGEGR